MPYLINELLPSLPKPVTANPEEPIFDALTRMLRHGYSQLPVVKGSGQSAQFYLVTSLKILEKLKFFGLSPGGKGLKVEHALVKVPRVFTPDASITEVMDGLKEMDAVLIVNDRRELSNVVTIYDTTHFFRRWSEDLLNAREVELALRKIIEGAFKRSDGTVDEQARQRAIDGSDIDDEDLSGKVGYKRFVDALKSYLGQQSAGRVTLDRRKAYAAFKVLLDSNLPSAASAVATSGEVIASSAIPQSSVAPPPTAVTLDSAARELRQRFEAALQSYLALTAPGPEVDEGCLAATYRQYFQSKQEQRAFNKLTLGVYIDLFFHDQCWGRCESVFDFERAVVEHILKTVQTVRNLLTHFREEEITDEHRSELRQAAEWMSEYQRKALARLDETAPAPPATPDGLGALLRAPAMTGTGSSP